MTTLPKEIEDTIYDETVFLSQDGYAGGWVEMKRQDIREICLKVYDSARRQALTEGIEAMPPIENPECPHDDCDCGEDDSSPERRAYRAEAIAKLTQLRDV